MSLWLHKTVNSKLLIYITVHLPTWFDLEGCDAPGLEGNSPDGLSAGTGCIKIVIKRIAFIGVVHLRQSLIFKKWEN